MSGSRDHCLPTQFPCLGRQEALPPLRPRPGVELSDSPGQLCVCPTLDTGVTHFLCGGSGSRWASAVPRNALWDRIGLLGKSEKDFPRNSLAGHRLRSRGQAQNSSANPRAPGRVWPRHLRGKEGTASPLGQVGHKLWLIRRRG